MTTIEQAMTVARSFMPYYSSVLFGLKIIPDPTIPTASTSKDWVLRYNPEYLEGLTSGEGGAVLCHEIGHVLKLYWDRLGHREPKRWNCAQDIEINHEINTMDESLLTGEARQVQCYMDGDFKVPDGCLLPETFDFPKGALCDDYYDLLEEKFPDEPPVGGGVGQGDCGSASSGQGMDDPAGGHISEYAREKATEGVAEAAAKHAQSNSGIGTLPGSIQRMIETLDAQRGHVSWQEQLSNAISWWSMSVEGDFDHSTTAFRSRNPTEFFLPGTVDYEPRILLAFDTSGSMGSDELQAVAVEAVGMVEAMAGTPTLVSVDTEIAEPIETRDISQFIADGGLHGGGGTDMRVATKYADKHEYDLCIIGTDGYTPWDDNVECQVLVLLTTEGDAEQFGIPEDFVTVNISG